MGIAPSEALSDTATGDEHFAIRAHCAYFADKVRRGASTKGTPVMPADGTPDLSFQPIPLSRYPKYGDFTVPTSELVFGLRK